MSAEDNAGPREPDGLLKRHPRLMVLLIAGIFYFILCSMLIVVLVLLLNRS
jgi:hypothetical protein